MKALSILIVFITICFATSYAQGTKAAQKPPKKEYGGKDDNCMLNGSYNKPLTITSVTKNKSTSTIKANDFVQFNSDGSYTEVINGVKSTGNWSFDASTKKINVNCNGSKTYDLYELPNGQFELKEASSSIHFNKQ